MDKEMTFYRYLNTNTLYVQVDDTWYDWTPEGEPCPGKVLHMYARRTAGIIQVPVTPGMMRTVLHEVSEEQARAMDDALIREVETRQSIVSFLTSELGGN